MEYTEFEIHYLCFSLVLTVS